MRTYAYHISRGYRRVTLWQFDPKTGQRMGRHTCAPTSADHHTRYRVIADALRECRCVAPAYCAPVRVRRAA